MFIKKANIKLYAAALFSALIASSCLNLDETQDGAYGYLTISGIDVNVQVEQLVPTKGADGETTVDISAMIGKENMPELSEVTVIPKTPQEGGPDYYTWKVGETLKLPRGVYTLLAECGENGFETPWFEGTGEVEVIALDSVEGKVVFTLANSVMKVTNGMTDHFTVADGTDVTISSTDNDLTVKSITTKMNNNTTDYVFVPSGKALYVKVTGSNTAGGKSKEYSVGITADKIQKGYAHNVILSVDEDSLPSVNFGKSNVVAWGNAIFITSSATATSTNVDMSKVKYYAREIGTSSWTHQAENNIISGLESDKTYEVMASLGALSSVPFTPSVNNIIASAKHTDTNGDASGGDLNGTDLKIDEESIPSNVKSNCTFTLNNSNGDTIHSFTSLQFVGADATDGWPYLPQGQYTLIATATVNGKEISSMTPIEVPAPEFGVTVSANTTYSYYKNQGASVANGKVAETIYDIASNVGISQNILDNTNYSKPVVTYSVGSTHSSGEKVYTASKNHSLGSNFEGLAWGAHVLKASIKFDNTTISGACDCYITGLPYDLSKAPQTDKWTLSGGEAEWDNNYIRLNHATENSATLRLSVIGSINVSLKTSFSIYTPTIFGSPSLTISAGGDDISKTTGASGTAKTTNYNDVTCVGSLSSNNPTIKFNRTYFAGREGEIYIKALLITYR